MKRKLILFAAILVPVLCLKAQNGDYVFDAQKLRPETTAAIDSAAVYLYDKGMTSKSAIGLFKESVQYVGAMTRGSDQALLDYCRAVMSIAVENDLQTLERVMRNNLAFLRDKVLISGKGVVSWSIYDDSTRMTQGRYPMYELVRADISCEYGQDTISVKKFSGVYDPFSNTFSADQGYISWELSPGDSMTVVAHNFTIDISSATFTADNARADMPKFRIKGLPGKLEFAPQTDVYPAFSSREGGIALQDKDATYSASGRVVVRGNAVSVEKDENSHARLLLLREGTATAVLKSSEIAVTDSILRIPRAMTVIYVRNDSVVHPLMLARYETVPRTLTLYQLPDKLSAAPFYDSFSAIKMFAKAVRLDNSTGDISFVFDASVRPAVISDKYFEPQIYKYFQGTAMRNPLPTLQGIYETSGAPYVSIDAIARGMGVSTNDAVHMAMDIAYLGYGNYDYEKRALMLYPGFAHMVASARGHSDFDGISYYGHGGRDIVSRMDGQTGHIDLSGMEMVKLSPKGDIFLRPDSSGVRLGQKGDFSYGGSITLGLFTVSGTDAQFLYEQNKIELKGTSSMSFEVPSFSNPRERTTVRNTIDSLRGSIEINAPNNKSAKAKNSAYPRITTVSQGYIFYDALDSLYSRDELFVSIEPFTLDSLASRRTGGIKFDGKVHTGIIVPVFDRTVSVQDDYTLGFSDADFSAGTQFYGRGMFYGIISLGQDGLSGKGRFTWLGAQAVSDSITMLPRTALAAKADFTVNGETAGENTAVPDVSVPGARVEWAATADSLKAYADTLAAAMYGGAIKFGGELVLSAGGLTGSGRAASDLAVMDSRAFSFGRTSIQSEDMDIRFGTEEKPGKVSLEKVGAEIDIGARTGRFTLSPSAGRVSLPEDSANVYLKETVWDMDGRSINFSAGMGVTGSITAKAGSADSLSFRASSAVYGISSDSLDISGVERLSVGDALIVPPDNSLKILPGGAIAPFDGAEIFLDTASRRHRLYDASVEIISGHRMRASATYDYTDPDGIQYPMVFDDISVDASGETVAAADTYADKDYELGAYFLFRGQSTLKGSTAGLGLRGAVRPAVSACNAVETGEMEIDIPLDSTGRMFFPPAKGGYVNGITYGADGFRGAFLKDDSVSAQNVFARAQGSVWYDDYAGAYTAAPDTAKGSYEVFRYFNDECRVNVRGEIFIRDPQEAVTMRAFGHSDLDLNTGRMDVDDMTLCMELGLPKEVSAMLSSFTGAMQAGAKSKQSLSAAYAYEKLLGTRNVEDVSFALDVPRQAAFTLMLSACDFSWDNERRRFFTSSPSFNIEQAGGVPLSQSVKGYVEIIKNFRSGDEVSVLIEGDGDFLFLRYKSGTTEFLCSSDEVMSVFDKTAEKYKNPAPGQYAIRRATKARLAAFRENMPVTGRMVPGE